MNTMRINARKHMIEATKQKLKQSWWEAIVACFIRSPNRRVMLFLVFLQALLLWAPKQPFISSPYRADNLYLCSFSFITAGPNMNKTILIVDPFSTGALYAPALQKLGYTCYGVISQPIPFSRFMLSYQGEGMAEAKLHSIDEIKQRFPVGTIKLL